MTNDGEKIFNEWCDDGASSVEGLRRSEVKEAPAVVPWMKRQHEQQVPELEHELLQRVVAACHGKHGESWRTRRLK